MHKLKSNKIVNCVARSHVPRYEYIFKWILEDYSRIKNKEIFPSPHFHPEVANVEWWVNMRKTNTAVSFDIHRDDNLDAIEMQCEITVASSNGQIWRKNTLTLNFGKCRNTLMLIESLPLNSEDVKYKHNDTVELILELKTYRETNQLVSMKDFSYPSDEEIVRDVHKSLSEDIVNLYENDLNKDIVLSIEGETLKVHKTILSARSPIFEKMFQQKMESNVVVIKDVTMTVMKEVIAFIYGKAIIQWDYNYDTALEVYRAALKYDIKSLVDNCRVILLSSLSHERGDKLLTIAKELNDKVMYELVMQYFSYEEMCLE